ncbi:DUF2103 domain-containing protein [Halocalculus aciditolerans]|uniref:Metal-binding protein n=1 Tax=Halocalculus aciditolerans TaxID=1383812 RepID=A0A830FFX3_9EURY|nr:DUF2103 domain-containing protein [Halocalculus aciditolerans]GGL70619.1 hypothetical protein GCM10009039_30840 [Halocalculus aciditolerans]
MQCDHCGTPLDHPGDYCLVCETANCDAVVVDIEESRATLTMLDEDEIVGRYHVTTTPESGEFAPVQVRNFAGRIGDELRRKRPDEVFVTGPREVVSALREDVRYEMYRVRADEGEDAVEAVVKRQGGGELATVDGAPASKLGGSHSTLIGDRKGWEVIRVVAAHPNVKKVIPGPIDASGSGSRTGLRAKATRADDTGNVRLIVRDGSSVQENRVVTTAGNRADGERVRADLNDALDDAGFLAGT